MAEATLVLVIFAMFWDNGRSAGAKRPEDTDEDNEEDNPSGDGEGNKDDDACREELAMIEAKGRVGSEEREDRTGGAVGMRGGEVRVEALAIIQSR